MGEVGKVEKSYELKQNKTKQKNQPPHTLKYN